MCSVGQEFEFCDGGHSVRCSDGGHRYAARAHEIRSVFGGAFRVCVQKVCRCRRECRHETNGTATLRLLLTITLYDSLAHLLLGAFVVV